MGQWSSAPEFNPLVSPPKKNQSNTKQMSERKFGRIEEGEWERGRRMERKKGEGREGDHELNSIFMQV